MSKLVLAATVLALAAPALASPTGATPTPAVTSAATGPAVHRLQVRAIVDVIHAANRAAIARARARQESETRDK